MSAFFLTNNNNATTLDIAISIFEKRGFDKPHRFHLSCGELLLYSKMDLVVRNYITEGERGLYCVGTIVYKNKSYHDSLKQLWDDLNNNRFDLLSAVGEFVLLYDNGREVLVIRDITGMYKLFCDKEKSFLTSSFMAASAQVSFEPNKEAIVEEFLYGFVAAPDTLNKNILDIRDCSIGWVRWYDVPKNTVVTRSKNRKSSIERQYKVISQYMEKVKALAEEYGAECGLSGGCDSRLIYASVNAKCCPLKTIHTHQTSKIHDNEIKAVKQIANVCSTPVVIIPTTYIAECEPRVIDETLRGNVLFFDARNGKNIGAANQTYMKWYKTATASDNGVTFSGVAGEIYRDFYHSKYPFYRFNEWLEDRQFEHNVKKIIAVDDYDASLKRIKSKVSKAIEKDIEINITPYDAKRFFDKYRVPNALSNVVSTFNQTSFYLTPFAENHLISVAAPDAKWQEHAGFYEGDIIERFNHEVAKLSTSRGYNFVDSNIKEKAKWIVLSHTPLVISRKLLSKDSESTRDRRVSSAETLLSKSEFFKSAFSYISSLFPNWDFSPFKKGEVPINNFVFVVCAVYETSLLSETSDIQ